MDDDRPLPGRADTLGPSVRRVLAPNPSPMTHWGTNTYLIGNGAVAVVDPGPDDEGHMQAILAALSPGERIDHILITHSHVDHSPLARSLSQETGAPVYAYGDSFAGRTLVMQDLAAQGLTGGGEGVDTDFIPDETLADGDQLAVGDLTVTALWTPGHMANHMSFAVENAVLTGDLVMGWASTMVSPPDGDLGAFMASARRLATRPEVVFYPGHGAPITTPQDRTRWLIEHRLERERQILAALSDTPRPIPAITGEIYTDVAPALLPAAERNVFAHLIDLCTRGKAEAAPRLGHDARFFLAPDA